VKTRTLAASALAGVLMLGGLPASALASPPTTPKGAGAQRAATLAAVPPRYRNQVLNWRHCTPDADDPATKRLECALMTVPRDWYNPNAFVDLRIAVSRLRPEQGAAQGSIIGNPGGPGGPGLGMPLLFNERPALAANFELVGFDPRGTGSSTNVTCDGGPNPGVVDARDRDRAVLDLVAHASKVYGEYCHVLSGKLMDFITTEQTVQDIDLLRALLGRDKINFVGYSGGSWMGAYYATYFPGHTGRFVLDSNTQFTAPWIKTFEWQPLGFERRFREDFAIWAARYDAQLHLGTTAGAVRGFYEKLRADFKRKPVELDLGFLKLLFDQNVIDAEIVQNVYSKHEFPTLAEDFGILRKLWDDSQAGGTAAAQTRLTKLPASRQASLVAAVRRAQRPVAPLSPDAFQATFTGIVCNDTLSPRGQAYGDRRSAELGAKYPIVGWSLNQNACLYWDRPSVHMPTPTGAGLPPVLMVQSKHDPATPYEGALAAHKAFAGSRLLTVNNEGDHGQYINGNECVDTLVEKFLTTGEAPAADTACEGTGIPAPPGPTVRAVRPGPLKRVAAYTAAIPRQRG
jgi:pimeloyl-ACP methyl ester carboxylesterase